jgi:hypothetical protein
MARPSLKSSAVMKEMKMEKLCLADANSTILQDQMVSP